jgi:hypothetical protein
MLYDSRKQTLAEEFGAGEKKCINKDSWMNATLENLNGLFNLYSEDLEFLYENEGFCATGDEEETEKSGVVISADGIKANVIVDGNSVGTTDTVIDLDEGAYAATLSKDGYIAQDIAFVVYAGKYTNTYATLVKEEETTEEATTKSIGAVLRATLNEANQSIPTPILVGENNWFCWEFENIGDMRWKGLVGVKLIDKNGNVFEYKGNSTYTQTVEPKEIKKLCVNCLVTGIEATTDNDGIEIKALLTKSS